MPLPQRGTRAVGVAAVAVDGVAVVALLAGGRDAVAAAGELCSCCRSRRRWCGCRRRTARAASTTPLPQRGRRAVGVAAVAVDGVAVVALLACRRPRRCRTGWSCSWCRSRRRSRRCRRRTARGWDPSCRLRRCRTRAPCSCCRSRRRSSWLPSSHSSPAVDDAVAAAGARAVGVAAVAVDGVAVVALLGAGRRSPLPQAVTVQLESQPSPLDEVAVVAALARRSRCRCRTRSAVQFESQPSPLTVLPSSHASPVVTGCRCRSAVNVQLVSQPSPLTLLPSSHCSVPWFTT